jgi:IS605 OrfB family transposase
MQSIKTVRCKLQPTKDQRKSLLLTLERFAAACNDVLAVSNQNNVRAQFSLHKLCYYRIKEQYGLTSNYAVRAIARVAASFGKGKKTPTQFEPTSADLDNSLLRFIEKSESVSLSTVNGRIKVKLSIGNYQRYLLKGRKPTAGTLVLDDKELYVNFILSDDVPDPQPPDDFLGCDLGISEILTDSDGKSFSGSQVKGIRYRHRHLRTKLQKKGTHSAKRLLKKISGKENRFAKDVNHCISKQVVTKAKCTNRAVVLEELKGIRDRIKARLPQRTVLHSWAFDQLKTFIAYKCIAAGVPLILVDPRNSSRECSECGYTDKANRPSQSVFACRSCGFRANADFNAAVNLRERGRAACQAAIRDELCKVSHNLVASRLL